MLLGMKLSSFLEKSGMSYAEFGTVVGASSEAVRLWVLGHRVPNRESMKAVVAATNGAVEPNDFFDAPTQPEPTKEAATG